MRKLLLLALLAFAATLAPSAHAACTTNTLDFATESLPTFYQGVPVTFQIYASGGTPGYTFAITSGSLPSGLHMSSSGEIEGEPDSDPGYFTIFVRVTDSQGCTKTQAFAITVEP